MGFFFTEPTPAEKRAQRAAAQEAKREAMERGWRAADEEYKRVQRELWIKTAQVKRLLTADDAWDRYIAIPAKIRPRTRDNRAIGTVVRQLVKDGIIEHSGCLPVPSRRRGLHGCPRTVWRSLIYGKHR